MNIDRLIGEFESLVRIDSLSLMERETADYLRQKLVELGCDVEEDDGAKAVSGTAGNVIARFAGTDPSLPPVLLSAHMDTVTPGEGIRPVRDGNVIRSSGDTILGRRRRRASTILSAPAARNGQRYPDVKSCSHSVRKGLMGAKALDIGSFGRNTATWSTQEHL